MEQAKVINLDLSSTKGTTIQVNGDPEKSFVLNLSDFSIYNRLKDGIEQLYDLFDSLNEKMGTTAEEENPEVSTAEGEEPKDTTGPLLEVMQEMDKQMRATMDYIFSAPVSDVCAPDGYMFDLFDGQLRFEHILNALTSLYEKNVNREYYNLKSRINNKLPGYVKRGK